MTQHDDTIRRVSLCLMLTAGPLATSQWLCACAQTVEPDLTLTAAPLIYGEDDRTDLFAETDSALHAQVAGSAFALIRPHQLRFTGADRVRTVAAPLQARADYCPGTRFLEQPTAAVCSATLIDSDLILTAAHCLAGMTSCRDLAYVAGYAQVTATQLALHSRDDVYACRLLAVREKNTVIADERFDFAVIQLDRAAPGPPVQVRPTPLPSAGDALTVVGFPDGLPVKIDRGAVLIDTRAQLQDSFTLTSDTFEGSSGSGVFNSARELVGVFALGTSDTVPRGGCTQIRALDASVASQEAATYAARVVHALCETGWPSQRLCGKAPSCGDGICSVIEESSSSCPGDCPTPVCGDSLCEHAEWHSCDQDCGDRRPAGVPDGWYCEPERYADGKNCDCECGAPDSDCMLGGHSGRCDLVGPNARRAVPATASGCSIGWPRGLRADDSLWLLPALAWLVRVKRRHQRQDGGGGRGIARGVETLRRAGTSLV